MFEYFCNIQTKQLWRRAALILNLIDDTLVVVKTCFGWTQSIKATINDEHEHVFERICLDPCK